MYEEYWNNNAFAYQEIHWREHIFEVVTLYCYHVDKHVIAVLLLLKLVLVPIFQYY